MMARITVSADLVQTVERMTDRQTGAMQEHTHIAFADVEQCANLGGIKVLLAAKDENRALAGWQRLDYLFNMLQDASSLDVALGGQVLPQFRNLAPVTATVEGVRQAVTTAMIVEEDGATFAAGPAARLVQEDSIDPARKRTSSLKEIDAAEHRDPSILDDLLGNVPLMDDTGAEADHRGIVAPIEAVERCCVAMHQSQGQRPIIPVNPRHAAPCLKPLAISETIIRKVQPHSTPSSHSDHALSVAWQRAVLQGVECFSGDCHD